ncbi:MAG: DUF1127 domain-containing protein [Alphaproteobacteria bacterium]|nr:DUF1127 domain-containing protein [Alphaproteobacteria bacterium]
MSVIRLDTRALKDGLSRSPIQDATRRPNGSLRAAAGSAIQRIKDAMQYRWRRSATMRALSQLDDAQLRDIGLERGQIRTVAEMAARHPALELTLSELAEMIEFPLPPLSTAQWIAANSNAAGHAGVALSRAGRLALLNRETAA